MAKDRLSKLLALSENEKLAFYDTLTNLEDHLDAVEKKLDGIDSEKLNLIKGDVGAPGYTPIKGDDYMTEDEVNSFLEEVRPVKGKDYFTNEEVEAFLDAATPRKGTHYRDGVDGKDGAPGKDGKDHPLHTPKGLIEMLNTTEGLLEAKVIKGIKSVDDIFDDYAKLPKNKKRSWTELFREDGNPFNYYQVGSSASGGQLSIGATVTGGSDNAVLFVDSGLLAEDPTNLSYDNGTLVKTFTANRVSASRALVIPPWQATTVYLAGDIVQQGNSLYKRIAGGTSGASFNATEEAAWNLFGLSTTGTIAPWQPSFYYEVGEVVTNNGTIYRTTTTHTSPGTFTAAEQTNFSVIANYTDTAAWTGSTVYPAGKLLTQGTRLIKRTADGTAAATFTNTEAANYTLVTNDTVGTFIPTTYYYAGEQVVVSGVLYQRNTSGISGATFNAAEAANWTAITTSGGTISPWTASTYYNAGSFVTQGNRVLYRVASGTSGATFNAAEAATWGLISNEGVTAWAASTYYYATEQVTYAGRLLQKTASGSSTTTFDATESALWSIIKRDVTTWVTSTYYEIGDYVILNTTTGDLLICTVSHTSAASFNTDIAKWLSLNTSGNAKAWVATTSYYIGDVVTQGNRLLRRNASGVSLGTFTNTEAAFWDMLSQNVITNWTATTYYFEGEKAFANGTIYQRNASGISGSTFDGTEVANWTPITTSTTYTPWTASTEYAIGTVVYQGSFGRILIRNNDGTSAASFTAAEANDWDVLDYGITNPWTANTVYLVGEQVMYQGGIIKSNSNRQSGATFDATEGAAWTSVVPGNAQWAPSTYYYAGTTLELIGIGTNPYRVLRRSADGLSGTTFDIIEAGQYNLTTPVTTQVFIPSVVYYRGESVTDVVNGNNIYTRRSAGLSGATFDATEKLNWTLVAGNPVTTITGAYTVVETDSIIECNGAGPYTITIPANRVNPSVHFVRLNTVAAITLSASGAETIVNPVTGTAAATTPIPGNTGTYAFLDYYKVGTIWQVA